MNRVLYLVVAFLVGSLALMQAQPAPGPSLRGVVTDPSGAFIPGAIVQLLGPNGEQRTKTDNVGRYTFATLRPGKYTVRVIAKGFSVAQKTEVDIASATELNSQLVI